MRIQGTPSRTNKRLHSTSESIPDQNKTTSTGCNDEQQQDQSENNMRRLAGTPLLGGNIAPRSAKSRVLTPSQQINRVQRLPAPNPRRSPLPSTYALEVSLDPANLSSRPDPAAIQQIKLVIPVIPRLMNGQADLAKMITMLIASATAGLPSKSTAMVGEVDTPGADFDLLLNSLNESGLVLATKSVTSREGSIAHL